MAWSGDPRSISPFRFGKRRYNPLTGEITLEYGLGTSGLRLIERLVFPHAPWPAEASRQAAFDRALQILHLVAGVSYYKAVLAKDIAFDEGSPDQSLAGFLTTLYIEGLAEFGYLNHVDLAERIRFRGTAATPPQAPALLLPERALVAMGGGKDSIVGLEMLRRSGMEVQPACVGNARLIGDTVRAFGLPLMRISRQLAPELQELNRAGAWNGHVPVTAINSAILLCAAILYGFRYVVFSNERSADEPTLVTESGKSVNHQYSKTSAFEMAFRKLVHDRVSPDIEYFSILRPFSELEIVRRFSLLSRFHEVYSSCNRNFHLAGPEVEGRWCGCCPKCRFAALSLAVFLSPEEVRKIQGRDLLAESEQIDGFRALCALGLDKPFECVGEAGESRAALLALTRHPRWHEHAAVRALGPDLERVQVPPMEGLMKASARHFIPPGIANALPGEFA